MNLRAAARFVGLARRRRFDVVHLHESDGVLVALAVRLARALGRPTPAVLKSSDLSETRSTHSATGLPSATRTGTFGVGRFAKAFWFPE